MDKMDNDWTFDDVPLIPKYKIGMAVSTNPGADPFMPGVGEIMNVVEEPDGFHYLIDGPDEAKYIYHENDIYEYDPY